MPESTSPFPGGVGSSPVHAPQPVTPSIRPDGGTGSVVRTDVGSPKIKAMDQKLGAGTGKIEDVWARQPSALGTGACHMKSFHCKLGGDSLEYLDRQINEWLDAHPSFEVKLVTTTVGEWQGKLKEPNLIVQVWV
ncbi:MAG: hypothetical protein IT437_00955 [Phycisphaerales bacterium]|nr:hypothetical protein [Phycisphaerales bacterium]